MNEQDSWILDNRWKMVIGIETHILSADESKMVRDTFEANEDKVMFPDGRIFNIKGIQSFEPMLEIKLKKLFSDGGWVCKHGHTYHKYEGYHVIPDADCWENKHGLSKDEACSEQPVREEVSRQRTEARRKLSLAEGPRLEDGADKVLPSHMLAYELSKHEYNGIKLYSKERKNYELPTNATWKDFQKEQTYFRNLEEKYKKEEVEIINSFKDLLPESELMKYLPQPKKVLPELKEEKPDDDEMPF